MLEILKAIDWGALGTFVERVGVPGALCLIGAVSAVYFVRSVATYMKAQVIQGDRMVVAQEGIVSCQQTHASSLDKLVTIVDQHGKNCDVTRKAIGYTAMAVGQLAVGHPNEADVKQAVQKVQDIVSA